LTINLFSMNRFLPLFPLGLVVFPGESLNLHVFEPRYQQLIAECESENITFGIPPLFEKKLANFGTEIRLIEISKRHADGRMYIKTEGIGLFKIKEFYQNAPDKLYAGADIVEVAYTTKPDIVMNIKILEYINKLYDIIKIEKELPEDPAAFSTYSIAHHVGFSINQELDFLQTTEETERQAIMLAHLEHMIPIVQETETLREKVRMNGHFKDLIPPDLPDSFTI